MLKRIFTFFAPFSSLPVVLQEQMSSTNMNFHQDGKYLYTLGGYAYNTATASKKIFSKDIQLGKNTFHIKDSKRKLSGTYFLTIETPSETETRKIIIKR